MGLLDVVHHHAGQYRTAEEYERRNQQYSLTRRGEAAPAGVRHAPEILASTGALRTAVSASARHATPTSPTSPTGTRS
ncbi:DUF2397 family protein [Streptomyces sp. NPDC047046]|uniref:DUF2397 family protein n=1 Tax=Streptomyces sp. NPDC047046 TaxID=3155378 RepID=UPI00340AE274